MIIQSNTAPLSPAGSQFVIGNGSFTAAIGGSVDIEYDSNLVPEDRLQNWPMVYILANDSEAYVGQTTNVTRRMLQHGSNPEKSAFTTINVIYNAEFNASVVTDYEHRLIQLMHADGMYQLTNKNDGLSNLNYFSKAEYDEMFEDLWAELRDMELVEHSIDELEESEVFKYSPFKALTADQQVALQNILNAIDKGLDNAAPIVVEGMPGTGKTVLAVYLLKALRDMAEDGVPEHEKYKGLNIRIVEPVTALKSTLQRSLSGVRNISKDDVIGPTDLVKPKFGYRSDKKGFDVLLVDEAHKLKQRKNLGTQFGNFDKVTNTLGLDKDSSQLDWVLTQARLPVLFFDPLQVIGPSGLGDDHMRSRLGAALDNPIRLESQMRVKGGTAYLEFVQQMLEGTIPTKGEFKDYSFCLFEDFGEFERLFEETIQEHSLTRMIAGYAWEWRTKKGRATAPFDIELDGVQKRWNCTYDNWVGKGIDDPAVANEVGCIHSIQGYDLSYAFVVLGNDIRYDVATDKVYADRSSYFDKNGKNTATNEELTQYIKNIYYVLLTRGISGTYLYVCDDALREHLKGFVPTSTL